MSDAPPPVNRRPCGSCRHLDGRKTELGVAYCWRWYVWRSPDGIVPDCATPERADGGEPPGRLHFEGEQRR